MTPCLVPLPAQLIKTLIRWIDVASDQRLVGCWFPILSCFLWLFGVVFFFNDTLASSTVVYHLKWSHHLLNWTMFVSFVMKTWHFIFFSYLFFSQNICPSVKDETSVWSHLFVSLQIQWSYPWCWSSGLNKSSLSAAWTNLSIHRTNNARRWQTARPDFCIISQLNIPAFHGDVSGLDSPLISTQSLCHCQWMRVKLKPALL